MKPSFSGLAQHATASMQETVSEVHPGDTSLHVLPQPLFSNESVMLPLGNGLLQAVPDEGDTSKATNVNDVPCLGANVAMHGADVDRSCSRVPLGEPGVDVVEQVVAPSGLISAAKATVGTGAPHIQMESPAYPTSEDPPPFLTGIPCNLSPIIFYAQRDTPSPSLRKYKKLARRSSNGLTSSLSVVGKRKSGSAKLLANSVPIKKSKAMAVAEVQPRLPQ